MPDSMSSGRRNIRHFPPSWQAKSSALGPRHASLHATKKGADWPPFSLRGWRRERDSNPRWSYSPHTPLAGERLQPLGHLSGIRGRKDTKWAWRLPDLRTHSGGQSHPAIRFPRGVNRRKRRFTVFGQVWGDGNAPAPAQGGTGSRVGGYSLPSSPPPCCFSCLMRS